MPLITV